MEAEKKIKQQQNTSVSDDEDFNETEAETTTEVMQNVEKRKNFLLSQIASAQTTLATYRSVGSDTLSHNHERRETIGGYFSYPYPDLQKLNIFY